MCLSNSLSWKEQPFGSRRSIIWAVVSWQSSTLWTEKLKKLNFTGKKWSRCPSKAVRSSNNQTSKQKEKQEYCLVLSQHSIPSSCSPGLALLAWLMCFCFVLFSAWVVFCIYLPSPYHYSILSWSCGERGDLASFLMPKIIRLTIK